MEKQALTNSRSSRLQWLAGLAVALVAWPALGTNTALEQKSYLYPEQRHERIGELVTQFIEKQHYNRIAVDDNLSSEVLDLFIESLDRNRMYLLNGDVEYFESYRFQLDDMVRGRSLAPVFEMYEVYQTRARERLQYALEALENEPDFLAEEDFQFDRTEEAWVASSAELDQIWRKRIKNEALNMALDHAMTERPNTLILGEDVGREGGVFRVTADMYEKYGADRMLDTPLCELGIVGTAIGMGMAGLRPVCEIEFAGFTFTAFDQIVFHVARYPWRTVGRMRFPMVIRMPDC
jgi:hypothetical protein